MVISGIIAAAFIYGVGRWHHREMQRQEWDVDSIILRRISE